MEYFFIKSLKKRGNFIQFIPSYCIYVYSGSCTDRYFEMIKMDFCAFQIKTQ